MGKPGKRSTGGIELTTHAVNRFRLRCSDHPILAKKPTAQDLQAVIRQLVRRGANVSHDGLKREERLVRFEFGVRSGKRVTAFALLAPSLQNSDAEAVVTILSPEMVIAGKPLRDES